MKTHEYELRFAVGFRSGIVDEHVAQTGNPYQTGTPEYDGYVAGVESYGAGLDNFFVYNSYTDADVKAFV